MGMARLIFMVVCGAGMVLLLAFGAKAGVDALHGRTLSNLQQDVLAGLAIVGFLIAAAIVGWFQNQFPWWQR